MLICWNHDAEGEAAGTRRSGSPSRFMVVVRDDMQTVGGREDVEGAEGIRGFMCHLGSGNDDTNAGVNETRP